MLVVIGDYIDFFFFKEYVVNCGIIFWGGKEDVFFFNWYVIVFEFEMVVLEIVLFIEVFSMNCWIWVLFVKMCLRKMVMLWCV